VKVILKTSVKTMTIRGTKKLWIVKFKTKPSAGLWQMFLIIIFIRKKRNLVWGFPTCWRCGFTSCSFVHTLNLSSKR